MVNGMVWERIPKEVFVGADLLEFGLFDAISHFNIGARAVLLRGQRKKTRFSRIFCYRVIVVGVMPVK